MSSIIALGVGRFKHVSGAYELTTKSQPLSSIGGRTGQLSVYDLSLADTKFARAIWGNKAARVGGNISASRFLLRNISHLSAGRVIGPVAQ